MNQNGFDSVRCSVMKTQLSDKYFPCSFTKFSFETTQNLNPSQGNPTF